MIKVLSFIITECCLLICCYAGTLPVGQQAEQTLITTLLTGYNRNIRPDQLVPIEITASIQQIISLDDKQQLMTSSLFITQSWHDERLSWTPSANNNIEVVMLPVKSLWIPDTFVLNSADPTGYLSVSDYSLVSVDDEGNVSMILPALTIKTRCTILAQKFPFDQQVCSINLTSWSQGDNRLIYSEDKDTVIDISQYVEHPLWELKGTDIVIYYAEDRAPFESTYNSVISIQLTLRRKALYFIVNGIFACLVLNCVTLLAYTLPFGTQVSLCMVCFMTYSVYSLNFSGLFPQQSQYIMMITLFFLLSIFWTLVSLAWFVVCNHYTSKGEMPKGLRTFCEQLQKICCCCFPPPKPDEKKDVVQNSSSKDQLNSTKMNGVKVGCVPCLKRRVQVENSVTRTDISVKEVEPSKNQSKDKCHFCDRCETCQTDFDKDKAKNKGKKMLKVNVVL